MGCECWNSVLVIGPDAEIARFRRECIKVQNGVNPRFMRPGRCGWGGYCAEIDHTPVTNYREHAPETGSWWFAFDTLVEFPERLFEDLVPRFPTLRFSCECIESMDDFMGYGWINVPKGGEAFRQDYDVPKDYWTNGGNKRAPEAEAKEAALVKTLIGAAHRAGAGHSQQ